jgi:hypothetical protein
MCALPPTKWNNWKIVEMEEIYPIPTFKLSKLAAVPTESALAGLACAKV